MKNWVNSFRWALARLGQAWPGKPIVSVESRATTSIGKVIVQISIYICLMIVVLEISHFGPKADRNFIFPILIHGDAVGWTCTLYGTSTLALACPLVWSFGSTWLGIRQEAEKYFDFWSTICPFSTNCPTSYLMIVLQSASLIVYAPVISSSSMHS